MNKPCELCQKESSGEYYLIARPATGQPYKRFFCCQAHKDLFDFPALPKAKMDRCSLNSGNCIHEVYDSCKKIGPVYPISDLVAKGWGRFFNFANYKNICERCLSIIMSSYLEKIKRNWINREKEQTEEKKQRQYHQAQQNLQKLEAELNQKGLSICHSCLNQINQGSWQKTVQEGNGSFSYHFKPINANYCDYCLYLQNQKEAQNQIQELEKMQNQDQELEIDLEEAYRKLDQLDENERRRKEELLRKLERNKKEMEKIQAILDDWEKIKEKMLRGEYIDVHEHHLSLDKSFAAYQMVQNYNQELKQQEERLRQTYQPSVEQPNNLNENQNNSQKLSFSTKLKNAWNHPQGKWILIGCGAALLICIIGASWTIWNWWNKQRKKE